MDYLSLCLICKDENDYLPEWLDYHILFGVDRFYIYDNDSQVCLRDSLQDYIKRGWVVVVDTPGQSMQLFAYDHCLQTFGANTFWMGFIDTDEFLVPQTTTNLKQLLKEYEQYAGLAVSSLFFGSNGHQARPSAGQIASYTRRTHQTFIENEIIKSIVQPGRVLMPNSPHDFTYRSGNFCVNENFLRVDYQRFPNYTNRIQLNHYYCRSEQEIQLKLQRGNSQSVAWPRKRFDAINLLATFEDTTILQRLAEIDPSLSGGFVLPADGFLARLSNLAKARTPAPLDSPPPQSLVVTTIRAEFSRMDSLRLQTKLAENRGDLRTAAQLTLERIQITPHHIIPYLELAGILHDLGDAASAWQALTQAWQIDPNNNYAALGGMALYFLRVQNFAMAENTCRLLLEAGPHDMVTLGMLTHSLIGQKRMDEAIKIGLPLVELSAEVGELPDRMGLFLVKHLAGALLEKKDYSGAVRLWQAGVRCQPGDPEPLMELANALLLAGQKQAAMAQLSQAEGLPGMTTDQRATLNKLRHQATTPPAHMKKRRH